MTNDASPESKISFSEEQDPVVTTISKKPVAPQVVDEAAALAATGEHRLEGIRQLIMRGMRLASFELSCAARLRSLTVSLHQDVGTYSSRCGHEGSSMTTSSGLLQMRRLYILFPPVGEPVLKRSAALTSPSISILGNLREDTCSIHQWTVTVPRRYRDVLTMPQPL